MRTTVDLPEPLLDNAKRRAAELNTTLSEVVQDGLRMVLNAQPAARDKKYKFKLITAGGGFVEPNMTWKRISEILDEEDAKQYREKFSV